MLVVMCGIPGSGKSTYTREELKGAANYTIICPDDFRIALHGKAFHGDAEDFIWATVKLTVRTLLMSDHLVILDATSLTKYRRAEWVQIAKRSNVPCDVIAMVTDAQVCRDRNQLRDRTVDQKTLSRQMSQYTVPSVTEGFTSVTLVENNGDEFSKVGFGSSQFIVPEPGLYASMASELCYPQSK